jgi:hypothetical protein
MKAATAVKNEVIVVVNDIQKCTCLLARGVARSASTPSMGNHNMSERTGKRAWSSMGPYLSGMWSARRPVILAAGARAPTN